MSTFKYLAFYMHRGAISNKDIVAYDGENVSFKYTESNSDVVCYRTLPALEFIRLCLRHVLPSGFQKTRYYGLLASANRKTVRELRLMILTTRCSRVPELENFTLEPMICPKCGMPMRFCGTYSRAPPSSVIPREVNSETFTNSLQPVFQDAFVSDNERIPASCCRR